MERTDLAPGVVLVDRYRLDRPCGRGASGEVWAADDLQLGEQVALKIFSTAVLTRSGGAEAVTQEVRLARRVTHSNVCRLHDVHLWQPHAGSPRPFVSMELLGGETLEASLVREGPMGGEAARSVIWQLAAGLAAAHRAGVVHRDLKSANVMLVDGGRRAVICDFGLAWIGESGESATAFRDGTPVTIAPEALRGESPTAASDVYALGVVAFELLTGEPPFVSTPLVDSPYRRELVAVGLRRAGVPRRWRRIIERCLSFDANRRPSAETVRRAFVSPSLSARHRAAAVAGVAVAAAVAWCSLSQPPQRPSVAVMPLSWSEESPAAVTERPEWLPVAMAELVTAELAATGKACPIDRERVAEVAPRAPKAGDESRLPYLQRELAVDRVLEGDMSWRGDWIRVRLQLVRTSSSDRLRQVTVSGSVEELGLLAARAARELVGGWVKDQGAWSDPVSAEALREYSEGVAALREGELSVAVDRLEHSVAVDPSSPLARIALARALAAAGMDGRASAEAVQAGRLMAGWPEAMRLEMNGLAARLAGDTQTAVRYGLSWREQAPDAVEAHLALIRALVAAGRGGEALQAARQAREARRSWCGDPRLTLEAARAAAAAGMFDVQLELARELAADRSSDRIAAEARLNEGRALLRLGRLEEAREALRDAAEMFEHCADRTGSAKALNFLAVAASQAGRFEEAEVLYSRSLAASEAVGDRSGVAHALRNLGIVARRRGDLDSAVALSGEALSVYQELGDTEGEAGTLVNLAVAHRALGELKVAEKLLHQALQHRRDAGNDRGSAIVLVNLGNVLMQQGRVAPAGATYSEAAELARATNDLRAASHALIGHAVVQWHSGDSEAALRSAASARRLRHELRDAAGCAAVDVLRAQIELDAGDCAGAAELATRAVTTLAGDRDPDLCAVARSVVARAVAVCGDHDEARAWLPDLDAATGCEVRVEVRMARAEVARAMGQYELAEAELTRAVTEARDAGLEATRLELLVELARVAAERGRHATARSRLLGLADQSGRMGLVRLERRIRALMPAAS